MGTLTKIVTLLLVALFAFAGTAKLMPFPSASIHYDMVSLYVLKNERARTDLNVFITRVLACFMFISS